MFYFVKGADLHFFDSKYRVNYILQICVHSNDQRKCVKLLFLSLAVTVNSKCYDSDIYILTRARLMKTLRVANAVCPVINNGVSLSFLQVCHSLFPL